MPSRNRSGILIDADKDDNLDYGIKILRKITR